MHWEFFVQSLDLLHQLTSSIPILGAHKELFDSAFSDFSYIGNEELFSYAINRSEQMVAPSHSGHGDGFCGTDAIVRDMLKRGYWPNYDEGKLKQNEDNGNHHDDNKDDMEE
nr:hypothetical protein HmN_000335700 [Hymenolepis microstoma]